MVGGAGPREVMNLETATVMIADDEPDIRSLLRIALQRDGRFDVVAEAANGHEAIDGAVQHRPDVVLLDLKMPGLDGRRALPQLVAASPRSMVVVLSVLEASVEEAPALAAGAFAYLQKDELTGDLSGEISALLQEFRRALRGETVIAPAAGLVSPRER